MKVMVFYQSRHPRPEHDIRNICGLEARGELRTVILLQSANVFTYILFGELRIVDTYVLPGYSKLLPGAVAERCIASLRGLFFHEPELGREEPGPGIGDRHGGSELFWNLQSKLVEHRTGFTLYFGISLYGNHSSRGQSKSMNLQL